MKTQKFKSETFKTKPFIAFLIIGLLLCACTKYPQYDKTHADSPTPEVFEIGPEGGIISAQNNEVFLNIPEGAVLAPTKMSINHIGSIKYESLVLMPKGYSISIGDQQLVKPITIRLKYGPEELCLGSNDEHCLKIYAYRSSSNGAIHKSDCFQSLGECCVDKNNQTVEACFEELGNFIVGRIN